MSVVLLKALNFMWNCFISVLGIIAEQIRFSSLALDFELTILNLYYHCLILYNIPFVIVVKPNISAWL